MLMRIYPQNRGGWHTSGVIEGYIDDSIANIWKFLNKINKFVSQILTSWSSHEIEESEISHPAAVPS